MNFNMERVIYLLCFVSIVLGGDYIPDRICARIYSEDNLGSDAFISKDFDQSVNLGKDYRVSISGWRASRSAQVENGCNMILCNGTYFTESCIAYRTGTHSLANYNFSSGSANCTCSRECKCSDISIQKSYLYDKYATEFGRAYLSGGFSVCNNEYVNLTENTMAEFPKLDSPIEAFVIRSGCNLTLFHHTKFTGSNLSGTFRSYKFECNDTAFVPHLRRVSQVSDAPLIRLPDTPEELIDMFYSSGSSASNHPGLTAALKSLQSGRSWRNAYVLLIGSSHPKYQGMEGCLAPSTGSIGECRLSVNMDHLGISNSELRIIFYNEYNGGFPPDEPNRNHDRFAASLDEYLSNHDDLKYVIPNAIIIRDYLYSNLQTNDQRTKHLRTKLRILNRIRARVLDENYSNVVFETDSLEDLGEMDRRCPARVVEDFAKEVAAKWGLPQPTHIIAKRFELDGVRKVNGFWKPDNGEYWPRNFQESLKLVSLKGGDELGHAIFEAYFRNGSVVSNVTPISFNLLPTNHTKVVNWRDNQSSQSSKQMKTLTGMKLGIVKGIVRNNNILSSMKERHIEVETELNAKIRELQTKSDAFKTRISELESTVQVCVAKIDELGSKEDLNRTIAEFAKKIRNQIWSRLKLDLGKLFE